MNIVALCSHTSYWEDYCKISSSFVKVVQAGLLITQAMSSGKHHTFQHISGNFINFSISHMSRTCLLLRMGLCFKGNVFLVFPESTWLCVLGKLCCLKKTKTKNHYLIRESYPKCSGACLNSQFFFNISF